MTLLFTYLILAIVVSFICSILEAVLLSVTPSYIESLKVKGKLDLQKGLHALKQDIDKPLAAILSFNTIAHTVGAAGVGAQATKVFGSQYLGVISAVLTFLILIFSEIIPKTVGANYWKSLLGITVKFLKVLIILMYPLVILAKSITKIFSKKEGSASISRQEIFAMTNLGEREGIFEAGESKMLKNMIHFRNVTAEDIMTPRTVIFMKQQDLTVKDLFEAADFEKISRIPIFKNNRDDVTGYVHKTDVLTSLAQDKHELKLHEIKREITLIDKDTKMLELLEVLMTSKEHIVLVYDKYGGIAGLVTLEDVIETVIGREIMDEFDGVDDMQNLARNRWQKRALAQGIISEKDLEDEQTKPKII